MEKEIEKCPFCGGEGSLEFVKSFNVWHVECELCASCGEVKSTREGARKAWNTRYNDHSQLRKEVQEWKNNNNKKDG